jgi:hypothetical protein
MHHHELLALVIAAQVFVIVLIASYTCIKLYHLRYNFTDKYMGVQDHATPTNSSYDAGCNTNSHDVLLPVSQYTSYSNPEP